MLITQRQEEVAPVEADTAKRAIGWDRMLKAMRGDADSQACRRVHSVLEEAQRSNVFALATAMEAAPGLAISDWLNRIRACGLEDAAAGGPLLPPIGRLGAGGGMRHVPTGRNESPVNDKVRSHIFYGDLDNRAKAKGWHYEPSADPKKGTYVIEKSRTAPDKNGVYKANVMIEGVKKGPISTFFPRDWSQEKVEQAVLEAYENRVPEPGAPKGFFVGSTSSGVEVKMQLDPKERIITAFPLFKEAP